MRRKPRNRFLSYAAVAALAALSACSDRPSGGGVEQPLFDGAHEPDVLTEAREIDFPPSMTGNRMLEGWWPWRRKAEAPVHLVPVGGGGGSLEITQLEERARRLLVEVEADPAALGRKVGVRAAGRSLALDLPLVERLEIDLPADLPLGRVPIELFLGDQQDVAVRRASVRPALAAGEVRLEEPDILQSGASLVDVVRPLAGEARLRGRFVPPTGAAPGQRFELWIQRPDREAIRAFAWKPAWWNFLRRSRELDLDLSTPKGEESFVRVRLRALGEGPAARWENLRIVGSGVVEATEPPPVAPPQPPRVVLLYVMDALRADHIGHLGGPAGISPTVDRLAAEGTTFTNYLTVAPNTVPSVKTMLSGLMFLQGGGLKLPRGPVVLPERYQAAGYGTALITGNGNISAWHGLSRGYGYAPRWTHIAADRLPGEPDVDYNDNAERCHRAALLWLDQAAPERAFIHIQTIHPHNPYDPPEPYRSRFTAGIDSTIDGGTKTLLHLEHQRLTASEEDERRIQGLYAGSVAYNDAELGRLVDELLARFPPEEVLIVVTSDHGDELFDHGGVLHGYTLYEEQLHVPLVFWWPGRIPAQRIDAAVDTLDLHHTLATLVADPSEVETGGNELWSVLLGEREDWQGKEVRFAAASGLEGGIFMARSERYKLLWAPRTPREWGMGQGLGRGRDVELVFDLEKDPHELDNLAGEDILEVAWLRERLRRWMALGSLAEPGETPSTDEEMDEETRRNLRALGYIQ